MSRKERVIESRNSIFEGLEKNQKEFLEFVLSRYIDTGVEELDEDKLPTLLNLKYQAISDAEDALGDVEKIRSTFFDFQRNLYAHSI
jgi:type I restriction enzyme R subunit